MSTAAEVQQLVDRAGVRDVIEAYMSAVDRCDYDAIAECFTADADLHWQAEPSQFTGGRALADWMRGFDHLPNHTHTVSSCHIVVTGDQARADTFATAVLVVAAGGPGSVLVMGLRYVDRLSRTNTGWLIAARTHSLRWQFNAAAEAIELPPQA